MSLYRDKAVVLRTYDLREADRIIVMMTENHGKVRAVAKGVRKTTSKFGARLEPLSHVDVLLSTTGKDLDIVSQVELVSSARGLYTDLDRLTRGLAMLEAVDQLGMDREPTSHLYKMLAGALTWLAPFWMESQATARAGGREAVLDQVDGHRSGRLPGSRG